MWLRNLIKEWGIPVAIFAFLYFTGLFSDVAALAQRAVLFTGVMNVDTEKVDDNLAADFNYNQFVKNKKGELVSLEKFKGKVIFINIWASWCAPCKAEMPGISELYEDFKTDKNVEFVMLSIDRNEASAHRYMEKNDYSFPYYLWTGQLNEQLAVPSVPTTFVVSKSGKIIKQNVGIARYNTKSFKNFIQKQANL